jgi:hypothetical protein
VLLPPGRRRSLVDQKIVGAYALGTISGASLTALGAWTLGGFFEPLEPKARVWLFCLATAFIWLAKEGPLGRFVTLPEARRQIRAEVFGGGLARGAYRFGFELGTGLRTYSPSPAPYVVSLALLIARPTLGEAFMMAAGFGLGRALPLLAWVSSTRRAQFTARFLTGDSSFGPNLATSLVVLGALELV